MKKNKLFWLLSLMLVLSVFLAACGDGEDQNNDGEKEPGEVTTDDGNGEGDGEEALDAEQVLNLIEGAEIPSVDSAVAEDQVGFVVLNNTQEGLFRLNQENVAIPAIAAGEPEISEDGLTYTFKIREDAKWSNGDAVTAKDFEFAWKRAIDPATGSPYGPYMMSGVLKNAEKIAAGEMDKAELGVKAEDDTTLVVNLERPVPYFLSLMSFGTFYPQNEAFVTEQGENYATNSDTVISNGPFLLTEWDGTGLSWVYKKNDSYWDAESVKLTQINWDVVKENSTAVNLYTTGEKDRTGLSGEYAMQYANDPDLIKIPDTSVFYLKFNQERNGKPNALANVNIREAVAKSFNKQDLTDVVLANGSVPANYLVPVDFAFDADAVDFREVNGDMAEFNAEEAKAAWEKGLAELGVEEVTLELLGGDSDLSKKMDEYMKSQMETNLPGLTVTLKEVPFNVRLELDDAQDYDIQFAGWGPDYQDPMTFVDLFVTGSPQNNMGYSSEEFDGLIEKAKGELAMDPEARWQAMADAEKLLVAEDYAIAPVYQRAGVGLSKPYVKGIVKHPFGGDYSYKWAYISGKGE
ncbi:peptide ABC transporter substrate-binding protein [Paenisporosarcina cavernae]|uniref:Peptide ABC transporter substrate-binding protein n=1 Tax=Paenisporosarcina cavernae TaxID=2320858 RepID=A0A385YRI5_9BACL|nr:peptide ABC transporter substrate-binding protein [Paenisporosarcina cavernae]AYC29010.1 peptide ABC transporter substrate-binding protein [Paenisporosarcina cavernae]